MISTAPFPEVMGRVQARMAQLPDVNAHMALLGQTGSGKDHLIRWGILPYFPHARVVVLTTKRGGDPTWEEWGNTIPATDLRPGFGRGPDGTPRYHVNLEPAELRDGAARVLDRLASEGGAILVVSDVTRIMQDSTRKGLGETLDHILKEGRSMALTVIACTQVGAWSGHGIKSQTAATWISRPGSKGEADAFADMAGVDKRGPVRRAFDSLPRRGWIYTDHDDGPLTAALTSPPPPGWCSEEWPSIAA